MEWKEFQILEVRLQSINVELPQRSGFIKFP